MMVKSLVCRIIAVDKLGAAFNFVNHSLKFTPRKMVAHPAASSLMIIETDHSAYTDITSTKKKNDMADVS